MYNHRYIAPSSRSRKGAWIEIHLETLLLVSREVAPVRERGLKSCGTGFFCIHAGGRSRKGAWIEMLVSVRQAKIFDGRSRKGAWIEINAL